MPQQVTHQQGCFPPRVRQVSLVSELVGAGDQPQGWDCASRGPCYLDKALDFLISQRMKLLKGVKALLAHDESGHWVGEPRHPRAICRVLRAISYQQSMRQGHVAVQCKAS